MLIQAYICFLVLIIHHLYSFTTKVQLLCSCITHRTDYQVGSNSLPRPLVAMKCILGNIHTVKSQSSKHDHIHFNRQHVITRQGLFDALCDELTNTHGVVIHSHTMGGAGSAFTTSSALIISHFVIQHDCHSSAQIMVCTTELHFATM